MKKIIIALSMFICLSAVNTFAQDNKTEKKAAPATTEKSSKEVKMKKDGTPDKRYKNAPEEKKGPVKKDGTPDKRYKDNKK